MAVNINLSRNTKVYYTINQSATGYGDHNTAEIQVLNGYTFTQGTDQQTIQINEAGATPNRGQRSFNTKLNPVERREIVGFEKKVINKNSIVDQVFLYVIADKTKLTGVFAVVLNGNLYIQQKNFRKYAVKGDKSDEGDNPNSYHRVLKAGKFLYLEAELANSWSKGLAYGSGGAVGGIIGSSMNRLKGIVFDINEKEFNILKDCKDFNEFLTSFQVDNVKCENKKIDIITVRENINKIIQ